MKLKLVKFESESLTDISIHAVLESSLPGKSFTPVSSRQFAPSLHCIFKQTRNPWPEVRILTR